MPPDWNRRSLENRKLFWSGEFDRYEGELVERDRICAQEIWLEALGGDKRGMRRAEALRINNILDLQQGWKKYPNAYRYGPHGQVKGGYIRK